MVFLFLLSCILVPPVTSGITIVRKPFTSRDKVLTFFKDYRATGTVSLPYAEIKEPFEAWYSATLNMSRIDFYGGTVKNVIDVKSKASYKVAPLTNEAVTNTITCFKSEFEEGDPIEPQSIVPDATLFSYAGMETTEGQSCDKWVYVDTPMRTHLTQTYTLYVSEEDQVPIKFVMEGFNILSGSHVDKYVVDYSTFTKGDDIVADNITAAFNDLDCDGFPGPGHAGSDNDLFADIISSHHDHVSNFDTFGKQYSKQYNSREEHTTRYATYLNNVRYVNSKNRQGLSYTLGMNHMADWMPHEHGRLRGKLYSGERNSGKPFPRGEINLTELPDHLDLRVEGAIGSVKDQAICGSCWSFATTGSIEGAFYNKYKYRISLSEQNLMDCSWGYGNNGCDGGEEWRAYEWIMKHGGIAYEEEYGPYLMADGYCHYNETKNRVEIFEYYNVTGEESLKLALFSRGAVAVNIDASHRSLSFYQSGVYYEPECKKSPMDLDHAVLAVGWGTLGGHPYWIVKNSWSTYWGNVGYVLMSRRNNNCGVTTDATSVDVK